MQDFILITSGFLIPKNDYFKLLEVKDDNTLSLIFNHSVVISNNYNLVEFCKNKEVYYSDTIDNLLDAYGENKTFDNFINIVNVAIDIFSKIDFISFFKIQASNTSLSNISQKFCFDCVSGSFFKNYRDYSIIPFNIRFTYNNNLTTDKIKENIYKIEKETSSINNWESFFTRLYEVDKESFIIFFRYIFADYY